MYVRKQKLSLISLGLLAISQANAAAVPMMDNVLPKTSVHVGYVYSHQNYKSAWEGNYRTLTGTNAPNDFSGVSLGLTYMLNDCLALDTSYRYYARKGRGNGDSRPSGFQLGALGFKRMNDKTHFLAGAGANVSALSHNGDGSITGSNRSTQHSDVNFYLTAGFQYQASNLISIRPSVNFIPSHDRMDTSSSYGAHLSAVFNMDK